MLARVADMKLETRTYRVNGIDMNVLDVGAGPAVLLVHGFPDTHAVWRKQIAALVAAGHRVIAPDNRGAGATDVSPRVTDYRVENLVADLVGLLDVLGVDRVRLVAHDWGAVIGWHLVIAHPERVARYVALSVGHPTAYLRDPMQRLRGYYVLLVQVRGLAERVLACRDFLGLRLFARYDDELPTWRASLGRPGRLTAGLNYYRANLDLFRRRDHPPVQVPVLGIWSSGDAFLTERQMLRSRQFVAAPWRYARIDGANHWMQLTAPERLTALVLEDLAMEDLRR